MKSMKNRKIIAIIPARGGSKGLPGKNIKPLFGKPLIAWTIESAKKSKYIDRLIVSTDDKKIADVSKRYGLEVPFLRPKKYARDDSPASQVVLHTLDWFKKRGELFDIVILLEPTSPLRKGDDIDRAIKTFLNNFEKADALVGAGKIDSDTKHPYGSVKKIKNGFLEPFIKKNKVFSLRQELPAAYSIYGGIYMSKVKNYERDKTFYTSRTIPYLIERWQHYEIDDIYDFICVEAILRRKLKEKTI